LDQTQWIGDNFDSDETSPTHEIEESLNVISNAMSKLLCSINSHSGYSSNPCTLIFINIILGEQGAEKRNELYQIVQSCLSSIDPNSSSRAFNTVLAVIGATSDSIKEPVMNDLAGFVERYLLLKKNCIILLNFIFRYVLPFFQIDQSTPIEKLVPINYYFATIFSSLGVRDK